MSGFQGTAGARRRTEDRRVRGGCTLYVIPPVVAVTATTAGGAARIPIPIADDAALLGAELFWQWCVLDPNGSWLGAGAFSPGLRTVLGR